MTIVDVATDRPHLGRRHVYVYHQHTFSGSGTDTPNLIDTGYPTRVIAAVLSVTVDCLLAFKQSGTSPTAPYEMRAGVPLVLPFSRAGHFALSSSSKLQLWGDTAGTAYVNAVCATDAAGGGITYSAETTAEHLGGKLHYIADTDTYPTAPTTKELLAAVSGKRLRVLQARVQDNSGVGISSFYSGSTTCAAFHTGGAQPGVFLPFNPVGWFTTAAGAALNFENAGSTGRIELLAQEAS